VQGAELMVLRSIDWAAVTNTISVLAVFVSRTLSFPS